jgi:hypothetical protein
MPCQQPRLQQCRMNRRISPDAGYGFLNISVVTVALIIGVATPLNARTSINSHNI